MTEPDSPLLTRREFLRRTALATAGTALVGCSDPTGPLRTPGRLPGDGVPKRVGIVGAGVSGLVAGYELTRAGHDVRIFDADRILCTAPIPTLASIEFAPPLSPEKARAVAGDFDYRPATRLFLRFRSRFWNRDGRNGWAVTDWPGEIWHSTWDLPGPEGVLLTYVRGEWALELDALDGDDRVRRVLARWEESVFPGSTAHVLSDVSHSWQDDPWSRGAWAAPTRSQDAELGDHVPRREGPIHFAGEHASSWRGWMQGALESGLRAAREIHRAAAA